MAATTADEANALIADAKCDLSCLPPGLVWYGILAALLNVSNGNPVPDATTLASEANCLMCVLSPGMVPYAIIQAIRGISTGGGGGTGGAGVQGVGSPEGVVTATVATMYRDTSTDALWWKNSGAGNTGWVQITGPF